MKKNLLTLMFGLSLIFVGAFTVRAETPRTSPNTINMSKKSVANNAVKLKKIESILKKGEAMNKAKCAQLCSVLLEEIQTDWVATQIVCSIVGWDSSTCNSYINGTLAAGDRWAAAGCDAGYGGTVTARNTNRRPQVIKKESFG